MKNQEIKFSKIQERSAQFIKIGQKMFEAQKSSIRILTRSWQVLYLQQSVNANRNVVNKYQWAPVLLENSADNSFIFIFIQHMSLFNGWHVYCE